MNHPQELRNEFVLYHFDGQLTHRTSSLPWFLAGCCQPSLRDDVIHKHGALVLFLGPVEFTVLGPQKAADMTLGDVEDSEVTGNSLSDNQASSKLRENINCLIKIVNKEHGLQNSLNSKSLM